MFKINSKYKKYKYDFERSIEPKHATIYTGPLDELLNYKFGRLEWRSLVFKKEIITPGIRFNSSFNDQKRTLSPKQAYKNGSDWLVIGRPITKGNIKRNIQNLIDHLS